MIAMYTNSFGKVKIRGVGKREGEGDIPRGIQWTAIGSTAIRGKCLASVAIALFIVIGANLAASEERTNFNSEIRPVLSNKCFQCHGYDKRLDTEKLYIYVRDLHATMLHQLGIDHNKLIFPYQGLDQKLTGVEKAHVVKRILL